MTSTEEEKQSIFDDDDEDFLNLVESGEDPTSTLAPSSSSGMSEGQKSRAEKNRLKALALKKARLTSRPYPEQKKFVDPLDELAGPSKKSETKLVDTNAGFFIEEDPDEPFDNYLVTFWIKAYCKIIIDYEFICLVKPANDHLRIATTCP